MKSSPLLFKLFLVAALSHCGAVLALPESAYGPAKQLGKLNVPFINELSGIADSRVNPGVVWCHNDSGDGAYVYALNRRAECIGVFLVRSASANDWEDMAWGPGPDGTGNSLYLGDIGDNPKQRPQYSIYRIAEPKLGKEPGSKQAPNLTGEPTIRRDFTYPDGSHNAECLMVHPKTGVVYIVTKDESGAAGVYRFPAERKEWWEPVKLERVGTVKLPGELITGGDISPDGTRVALRTYATAYELRLPPGSASFDDVWKATPTRIPTPFMTISEAICYTADGKSLLISSEGVGAPLYELPAK